MLCGGWGPPTPWCAEKEKRVPGSSLQKDRRLNMPSPQLRPPPHSTTDGMPGVENYAKRLLRPPKSFQFASIIKLYATTHNHFRSTKGVRTFVSLHTLRVRPLHTSLSAARRRATKKIQNPKTKKKDYLSPTLSCKNSHTQPTQQPSLNPTANERFSSSKAEL